MSSSCRRPLAERALLFVHMLASADAFKVTAPQGQVLAVYGRPVVLGCSYTTSETSTLNKLIVTWQRTRDNAVVHSFYYSTDQLDLQNAEYRGRTQVFSDELLKGNASLRLDKVRQKDEDTYLCTVSNVEGTGKAEVRVNFAAFYTEPLLTIQMHRTNVTFCYESEGYPAPEVQWVDLMGQNLSHTNVVKATTGSELLLLQTHLVLETQQRMNYTFTLKNRLLSQVIERPVVFSDAIGYSTDNSSRWIHSVLVFFIVLSFVCNIILLLIMRKKRILMKHPENGNL